MSRSYEHFKKDLAEEKASGGPNRHSKICNCLRCQGGTLPLETLPPPSIAKSAKRTANREAMRAICAKLQKKIPIEEIHNPVKLVWPFHEFQP